MITSAALLTLVVYLFNRWEVVDEDVRWVHSRIEPTVAMLISLRDVLHARACPRPSFPRPKSLKAFMAQN